MSENSTRRSSGNGATHPQMARSVIRLPPINNLLSPPMSQPQHQIYLPIPPPLQQSVSVPAVKSDPERSPSTIPKQQQQQQQASRKRQRKKFEDVKRLYYCDFANCNKGYGSLTHLNEHRVIQKHGPRKKIEDFKHIKLLQQQQQQAEKKKRLSQPQVPRDTTNSAFNPAPIGISSSSAPHHSFSEESKALPMIRLPPLTNAHHFNNRASSAAPIYKSEPLSFPTPATSSASSEIVAPLLPAPLPAMSTTTSDLGPVTSSTVVTSPPSLSSLSNYQCAVNLPEKISFTTQEPRGGSGYFAAKQAVGHHPVPFSPRNQEYGASGPQESGAGNLPDSTEIVIQSLLKMKNEKNAGASFK